MTSYQSDGDTAQPAASVEELLLDVGGTADRCYRPLEDDDTFLAEIIVNIFLIQDSNSHPVFRLDTAAGPHQVGLETIGECGDTVVVVVIVVTLHCVRQRCLPRHWQLLQPRLLSKYR